MACILAWRAKDERLQLFYSINFAIFCTDKILPAIIFFRQRDISSWSSVNSSSVSCSSRYSVRYGCCWFALGSLPYHLILNFIEESFHLITVHTTNSKFSGRNRKQNLDILTPKNQFKKLAQKSILLSSFRRMDSLCKWNVSCISNLLPFLFLFIGITEHGIISISTIRNLIHFQTV